MPPLEFTLDGRSVVVDAAGRLAANSAVPPSELDASFAVSTSTVPAPP